MNLEAIGYVHAMEGHFQIKLNESYRDGLKELSGFSHLQVICWGHLTDNQEYRALTTLDKPYKNAPETIGVFATRSPARPNPILLSVSQVKEINVEAGVIEFYWLDLEEDTPVLDIKPYHPCTERVLDCKVPEWCSDWPESYDESATFDWSKVFNF
ncbi:SAM-dependent methyltransferase [Vibrio sp. S12_S33]|uniref:SAM-dependent methyltransferase n=1 Tax=Vibrio sp. S12_S33 TaxID=2720223 RepID=UPI00177C862F|nr:SAM-dependent methyltransferase [Vibrio sp. S12_S33]MBD1566272.1 SAM-dependent methyltransferase [Vibrio sp. S12_S33]